MPQKKNTRFSICSEKMSGYPKLCFVNRDFAPPPPLRLQPRFVSHLTPQLLDGREVLLIKRMESFVDPLEAAKWRGDLAAASFHH